MTKNTFNIWKRSWRNFESMAWVASKSEEMPVLPRKCHFLWTQHWQARTPQDPRQDWCRGACTSTRKQARITLIPGPGKLLPPIPTQPSYSCQSTKQATGTESEMCVVWRKPSSVCQGERAHNVRPRPYPLWSKTASQVSLRCLTCRYRGRPIPCDGRQRRTTHRLRLPHTE